MKGKSHSIKANLLTTKRKIAITVLKDIGSVLLEPKKRLGINDISWLTDTYAITAGILETAQKENLVEE